MSEPTSPPLPAEVSINGGVRPRLLRRLAESVLFVTAWMALGWALGLAKGGVNESQAARNTNLYLLLGVPLLLAFQLIVRRQPLRALWVRQAPPFRLDGKGIAIAVALMILPLLNLLGGLLSGHWDISLYGLVSLVGALAAAYAIRTANRQTLRLVLLCLAGTLALRLMTMQALRFFLGLPSPSWSLDGLQNALLSFLSYIPVMFVLEEVVFRGALDTHLHEAETGPGWLSAALVSALWGLWHLPIFPGNALLLTRALVLLWAHVPIGLVLSWAWRRSGNLLVPGISHSCMDALRNGFGL
jgi:membrane protease YdiL (CAAX protease family)